MRGERRSVNVSFALLLLMESSAVSRLSVSCVLPRLNENRWLFWLADREGVERSGSEPSDSDTLRLPLPDFPESRLRVLGSRLISVPRSFTPCLLLNEPFLARERPLLEKPDVLSDRDSFLKEPDLLRVGSLLEELDLRKERSLLEDPDRLTDRFFWEPDLLMGPSDRLVLACVANMNLPLVAGGAGAGPLSLVAVPCNCASLKAAVAGLELSKPAVSRFDWRPFASVGCNLEPSSSSRTGLGDNGASVVGGWGRRGCTQH
mmetsp:Transcript_25514/g.69215  ORF Transcript_25514/g.69215 Transcript_25514/m.69215 type:complete len:261 (-) Transcript_25514:1544-2326(-)